MQIKKGHRHNEGQTQELLPIIEHTNMNQTININSPKFDATFMINETKRKNKRQQDAFERQHRHSRKLLAYNYHKKIKDNKKSTLGFDNWILNKNLKEFGETRRHGFFGDQKISPYLTHRFNKANSTMRHESLLKNRQLENIYDDINLNKRTIDSKNTEYHKLQKTISHQDAMTLQFHNKKLQIIQDLKHLNRNIEANHDQPKLKNQTKEQVLNTTNQKKKFRTNKFVQPQYNHHKLDPKKDLISTHNQDYPINQSSEQHINDRKQIDRSISEIDRSIKKTFETYIINDRDQRSKSRNDIQIYLNNVKQPILKAKQNQFVSKLKGQKLAELAYEFKFDEQKPRKKLKTPSKQYRQQLKDLQIQKKI